MKGYEIITINKRCTYCDKIVKIDLSGDQYQRLQSWASGQGCIQNLLPDLSVDVREMFISGICSECWDSAFGGN